MDSSLNNNISIDGKFLPSFDIRSLKTAPNATQNFKRDNPDIDIFAKNNGADEDTLVVDIDKLNRYIQFQVSFRKRVLGKSSYKKAGFRKC